MRKLGAVVAALVLAAPAWLLVAAAPAGASGQEGFNVGLNQTVTRTYPGIAASDAAYADYNPDDCKVLVTCDTVPITVAVPTSYSVYDDYRLKVELDFVTSKSSAGQNSAETVSLDLYLWDDPAGAAAISQAAGLNEPQYAVIDRPTKGKYQIVVHNSGGVNDEYTIKATLIFVPGTKPVESAEPTRPSGAGGTEPSTAVTTPARAVAAPPPTAPAPTLAPSLPLLAPAGSGATPSIDPLLAGLGEAPPSADQVAGPARSIFRRAAATGNHAPVSSVVLAFWLGLVPVVAAAAMALVVVRRRPAVIARGRAS